MRSYEHDVTWATHCPLELSVKLKYVVVVIIVNRTPEELSFLFENFFDMAYIS